MGKENNLFKGVSEPENVTEYLEAIEHPMKELVLYLRKVILSVDDKIGEGIYWNAPTFYFTGDMKPFSAKEYKRYIVGFVFNKKDCVRLVFLQGASDEDPSGILEGTYTDGRRLAVFHSLEEIKSKEKAFKLIIKDLLDKINE